ncbi:MAG: GNAT family N-acetyltransferase [Flavobacteriaceae bacterium]|nr:MAG: GNAT family N-acetyltransferase [Flavobacteriaceae bacterium]
MVVYKKVETTQELNQIIALQKKNLFNGLTLEEREKEGFVSVTHSLVILERMNTKCAHTIAVHNNIVIGFALSMHPMFAMDIELLKPMFVEIEKNLPRGQSYITMGQICIDKTYRGQGIFRKLYVTMKKRVLSKFDVIVTEVDASNTRSLNAHYAVGFSDLTTYISNGQTWKLIVLHN